MWLPKPIYAAAPYAVAAAGIFALIHLPTLGQVSGALLLVAAYSVFRLRRQAAAPRSVRRQKPSSPSRRA